MSKTSSDPERLTRECRIFTQYLIGGTPTAYVVDRYLDFHLTSGRLADLRQSLFDRILVSLSVRGPQWTRLVDTYASRFCRQSVLRKKLILVLGLLECSPPHFQHIDSPDPGTRAALLSKMAALVLLYGTLVVVSTALLLPLHLTLAAVGRTRSS